MGWGWDRVGQYLAQTYSPPQKAADWAGEIARLCNNIYGGQPGDDASIAVIKTRRPNNVVVMIGPPRDKTDDAMVVDKFMRAGGIKVVCGGTTGNIVGRVLGREVRVDLSSRSQRVPPIGIIPGIDLVTEGAVTLVDALDKLKGSPGPESFKDKDGASRLASLLHNADRVHFMVGTAANQGLYGEGVPNIYIYKEYIIRDLIRLLRDVGKNVTVEYF